MKQILVNGNWINVTNEFDNNSDEDYFENEDLQPCIYYQFNVTKDERTYIDSIKKGTVQEGRYNKMEIKSVKIQGDGYLLNDEMYVPKADGNREYELIKEWLKDNKPEPEFTDEELAQQEQGKVNAEALAYLASTDWYIVRFSETGVAIPDEVKAKRQEARDAIK